MKADIQDFLLPFLESGQVKIIGLTTENPYRTINEAIRSRCLIYEVYSLSTEDVRKALINVYHDNLLNYDGEIKGDVFTYISNISSGDLRSAINLLEVIVNFSKTEDVITQSLAIRALGGVNKALGHNDLYDILSAFQKAIRGSDVDASLHYLARLLSLGDLEIIKRRLLVIFYEDIGLANPNLGPRVLAACDTAISVGLSEAKHPLAVAVIEMALSPKSNTAYQAINKAIERYNKGDVDPIPNHILNTHINKDPSIYKYPHDYKNSYVVQQYLPDNIVDDIYYEPKSESNYESALKKRLEALNNFKKKGL